MPDALRILITVDAGRTDDGAVLPHVYATQIDFLRRAHNIVEVFGVDDRTSPAGIFRNIQELRQVVNSFQPHLVVAYYGTMVAAISRLAAGHIPLVVTFRGSDLQGTSNPGWKWQVRDRLGRLFSLWAASGARRIIVNGDGLLDALPDALRRKAHNIPNGIDTDVFAPLSQETAFRRLGRSWRDKAILFNGGLGSGQAVKNRPLAEDVMSRVGVRRPEVHLQVISSSPREEVALLMNLCDCLLVTSLHEGSPDLVKEAMACNLPVVSVPCGDVRDRLRDVVPGGVASYDAGGLAELVDAVLQTGLRSNGRDELFRQGLDIGSVTERVLHVYRMAVG